MPRRAYTLLGALAVWLTLGPAPGFAGQWQTLTMITSDTLTTQAVGGGRRFGRRGGSNPFQYGWSMNLASAKSQAKKTGKPMMVVIRCVP